MVFTAPMYCRSVVVSLSSVAVRTLENSAMQHEYILRMKQLVLRIPCSRYTHLDVSNLS